MMSLETIHRLNDQIATEAAERALLPYIPFDAEEVDYWPPIPIPNLGTFMPDDWERTHIEWLVDDTGHGFDSEPALSIEQFKRRLRAYVMENPGHGFGIVNEGEFQVIVAAFAPVSH